MKGTKVERPKGSGRWVLRVEAGRDALTGKRRRIARTYHGKARAADNELARLVAEQAEERTVGTSATLAVLLDRWMTTSGADLSPTTRREYHRLIKTRIRPAVGDRKIQRLDGITLDLFYKALLDSGLGAPSVVKIHAIIHRACEQGVKWGWLNRNPADQATRPALTRPKVNAPTAEAVVQLFTSAPGALGTFLVVAACSGARRGEVCGLRWSDLNLLHGEVTIQRNVVKGDNGELVTKSTKTGRDRTVALPQVALEALALHRRLMEERAGVCEVELDPDAYVFSNSPRGVEPWNPSTVTSYFADLRERVGFDGRLHDLRHGHVSMLLAAGVDINTVVKRAGHANQAVTIDIYGHRIPSADRAAAEAFGELLAGPF